MNDLVHQTAAQLWQQATRPRMIVVTGNSMLPLLRAGDQALVVPVNRPLLRGDLVVIAQEEQWVIHRLIRFVKIDHARFLLTKGDNGPSDPPVTAVQVVGLVVVLRRGDVSISLAARRWQLLSWLIAVTTSLPKIQRCLLRATAHFHSRFCSRHR